MADAAKYEDDCVLADEPWNSGYRQRFARALSLVQLGVHQGEHYRRPRGHKFVVQVTRYKFQAAGFDNATR